VAFIHHFDLLLLAHSKPLLDVKLTMTYAANAAMVFLFFLLFIMQYHQVVSFQTLKLISWPTIAGNFRYVDLK